MTRTPSTVPVIGSTTKYTITCDVTVSCTGLCNNDTITISWRLNGNSINSATLTEFNNSSFTSTVTTVGDISLSHAGQYQCTASLTDGISHSNTTHFGVKCKFSTSSITIVNNGLLIYFYSTYPFNYCY